MPGETLSKARALALAPLPLGSATTWDPAGGFRVHPHLDVAARHVVTTYNARILSSSEPLSRADERALLDAARAAVTLVTTI